MVQRFARAVLALLCVVAVVYGTAMFPAAFDVRLGPDTSSGPTVPSSDPAGVGQSDTGPVSDTPTATPSGETETASSTPDSATETATPAASGDADGETRSVGLFGYLLLGFAGTVICLTLGLVVASVRAGGSVDDDFPLQGIVSRLPLPAVPLRRIPQVTTLLIVSAGGGLARLVDDLSVVSGALAHSATAGVGPITGALGRGLAGFPTALGGLLAVSGRSLGSAGGLLGGLGSLGFLRGGVSPADGESATPTTDVRAVSDAEPTSDDDAEPVTSVREAWADMTELVPVRNPETATAAEYARRAVDDGLPAAPVERLTALFREVRYGGRPDSEERVTAARRALDALTGGEE